MSLLKERVVYKPFEYPKAFDYYMKQQQAQFKGFRKEYSRRNLKRICTD